MDLYKSSLCWYDYIEVRDGYWRKAPLLGRTRVPPDSMCLAAASNSALVHAGLHLFIFIYLNKSKRNRISIAIYSNFKFVRVSSQALFFILMLFNMLHEMKLP